MLNKKEIERYDRQIKLSTVGLEGQERLKAARVLVIGAGGLGCPLIIYLSSAGIGNIDILDGDLISISNLQRQILYTENDLGVSKAQKAAEKAKAINPYINITPIPKFLNAHRAIEIFDRYDLIIDCTDNFGSRYLINDVCELYGVAFISAALHKVEGQLGVYNVSSKDGSFSASYRDVFPEAEKSSRSIDCNEAGVMPTLPGIMGLYQANEALKFFLDKETCLINKVLFLNSKNMSQFLLESALNKNKIAKNKEDILSTTYDLPCSSGNKISTSEELIKLMKTKKAVLIDVREYNELPKRSFPGMLQIPLSILMKEPEKVREYNEMIFVCKSGIRSKKACELINEFYPDMIIYDFSSGIMGLPEQKTDPIKER